MAVLGLALATAGVAISLLHAATEDPLAELIVMEPGEVVLAGRLASPLERSGFGYMADFRVDLLRYHGKEILRGGGVEAFAGDLSVGVGDRMMVEGEISLPQVGEDGFDYQRYLATKRTSALVEATNVRPMGEERGWIGQIHRRTDVARGYGLRAHEAAVVRGMFSVTSPSCQKTWRRCSNAAVASRT
jgi:competence protein ComEC